MSPLALNGLASGMDTDSVVSQLMAVERQPRTRTTQRQAAVQARQDGLNDISAKLAALKSATIALRSVSTWEPGQTVTSSATSTVSAKSVAGAGPGGHTVSVTSLARAEQRTFTWTTDPAAQTLTIGGKTVEVAANASVADAVTAINATEGISVYAVKVGDDLVLAQRATGAANTITASTTSPTAMSEVVAKRQNGADASFTVDNVAYTRASNVVTDVVAGVELTLRDVGNASISVGVPTADADSIVAKVKAFTDAYNAVVDATRAKTGEKRVANPGNNVDARKGALFGDSQLNNMLSTLRQSVGALGELGVSTGAATGTATADAIAGRIKLTESTLREKLASDPTAVQRTLGGLTGTSGFAQALEASLEPLVQPGGVLAGRVSATKSELTTLASSLTQFDSRMTAKESRLRAQFNAMELAMQRSQEQMSRLQSYF